MKRKIFSILFALVLAVSLVLVPAANVGAAHTSYTLLETLTVDAQGAVATSTTTLFNGRSYKIEASGTWSAGPTWDDVDAEYASDDGGTTWTDSPLGDETLLELMVDGNIVEWGSTYSSSHVYTLDYVGAGSTVSFQIYDTYYPNNSGSLTVNIYVANEVLYVPDDYPTIQAAVDAALPGDTIKVRAGTYNETVTIASDDYDLTLVGKDAVIADMADGSLLYGIDLKGGAHDISISGFEIMGFDEKDDAGIAGWTNPGDPDFAPMSHITIHHNYIHDNYDGINIGAWTQAPFHHNITIQHNEIEDNHYRGINLWAVSDSTVAHNEILNNGGDWNANGVFDEVADDMNGNGVTDGDGMTWVYVSDSTATHNTINGSSEVGLSINQCTGNTVTNNDVTNNLNLGIALFGWGAPTTGNQFVRNDAQNNVSTDILCYLKYGSMVYGNTWVKNKYDDANPDPPQ